MTQDWGMTAHMTHSSLRSASVGFSGRGYLFQDHKHPMTPGNNTEDVSKFVHHEGI